MTKRKRDIDIQLLKLQISHSIFETYHSNFYRNKSFYAFIWNNSHGNLVKTHCFLIQNYIYDIAGHAMNSMIPHINQYVIRIVFLYLLVSNGCCCLLLFYKCQINRRGLSCKDTHLSCLSSMFYTYIYFVFISTLRLRQNGCLSQMPISSVFSWIEMNNCPLQFH